MNKRFFFLLLVLISIGQANAASDYVVTWNFDGNSNDSFGNPSSNTNILFENGSVVLNNKSLISVPNKPEYLFDKGITLAGRVKPKQIKHSYIIFKGNNNASSGVFLLQITDFNRFQAGLFEKLVGGGVKWTPLVESGEDLLPDKWYDVVFTYDNKVAKLFVNNKQVSSINYGNPIIQDVSLISMGNRGDIKRGFEGLIDYVELINRSLSEEEIAQRYGSPVIIPTNSSPQISNAIPTNNSINVDLNPVLSVYAGDVDGDLLNVNFSYYNAGVWKLLKSYKNSPPGKFTSNTDGYMTAPNTVYKWKVTVSDKYSKTEKIFQLKTGNMLKFKWMANVGRTQATPVMGDIDKDGVQEIVISGNGSLKAIDGKTGKIKWSVGGASSTAVELVDLDGDGTPEVLSSMVKPIRLRAINGNGTIRWTSPTLKGENPSLYPIIGYDIDGDGYPTIYYASEDMTPKIFSGNLSDYTGRVTMLDHKGNILKETWVYHPCWGGFALGDVNFDGQFELYLGDRGYYYHPLPARGLQAWNAHTLQRLWNRSDLQGTSNFPIIVNVTGDENLEVIGVSRVNKGVGVLNSITGSTILNYLDQNLLAHGSGTVYDIDGDNHPEIMLAEGQGSTSAKKFIVFDLITGKIDFQPTLEYNIAWPPSAGDVNGDGKMEILAGLGLQDDFTGSYPIKIYDGKYNLLETVTVPNAGQLAPPRVFDVDSDGYNELVVATRGGLLYVYDTRAKTPNPPPRTWTQWYSEYRQGAAEYVPPPGPKSPVIKLENPLNNSKGVSINPSISVKAYDFQKDIFNLTFEIYTLTGWKVVASYKNQKVLKFTTFSANTIGYADKHNTTYNWRVSAEDSNHNINKKIFRFTTN